LNWVYFSMFAVQFSIIEHRKPKVKHVFKMKILTNLVHSNEFILNVLYFKRSKAIVMKF